jgi:hypothetical protein
MLRRPGQSAARPGVDRAIGTLADQIRRTMELFGAGPLDELTPRMDTQPCRRGITLVTPLRTRRGPPLDHDRSPGRRSSLIRSYAHL